MSGAASFLTCAAMMSQHGTGPAQEHSAGPSIARDKKALLEAGALQGPPVAAREIALFLATRDEDLMEYWNWIPDKYYRPRPTDPSKVVYTNPQTGKKDC